MVSSSAEYPTVLLKTLSCKQGAVRAVRFNVDGNYCMTCGGDKSVKLWNPARGLMLKNYSGHGYEVLDACGSSDNAQIASCGMDKTVAVFDVESGKMTKKFRGHAGHVNSVAFNEESTVVFSASVDGTVKAWDLRGKERDPIQTLDEATDSVTSVCVTEHEIAAGSADNRVRRYDLRLGQMLVDFVGSSVTSVCFTKDGQCALISSLDSTVRLLDKDSGELLADFKGHKNLEYKIDSCLMYTDAQVVSGSEDGMVYGWDLVQGKQLFTLPHGKQNVVVHSIAAHPTKPILLSACKDQVYYWTTSDDQDSV